MADADVPVPFSAFVMRLGDLDGLEAVYVEPKWPLTADSLTVASGPMMGRGTIESELGFVYAGDVAEVAYVVRAHGSDLDAALAELEAGMRE